MPIGRLSNFDSDPHRHSGGHTLELSQLVAKMLSAYASCTWWDGNSQHASSGSLKRCGKLSLRQRCGSQRGGRIKLIAPNARGQNTVHPSRHSDPSMPPTSSVILQGVGRSPFLEAKTSRGGLVERVTAGWPSGCS